MSRMATIALMILAGPVLGQPSEPAELGEPGAGETPSLAAQLDEFLADVPLFEAGFFVASWENDGPLHAIAFGDDRHYTNGVSLEASIKPNDVFYQQHLAWADLFGEFDRPTSAIGIMARHTIYTPEDIDVPVNQPNDWPYNGLATAGVFVQRSEGALFDHAQLDAGVMGQDAGGQAVQEWVHAALPRQVNPSWAGQVANQLALQGHYQRRWKLKWQRDLDGQLTRIASDQLDDVPMSRSSGFELIPYAGVRAGTIHIDGSFGAIVRYGWPLPDDFGPSRLYEFTDHTQRGGDDFGFSMFARAGARAVVHNALIRGSVFDSPRLEEQFLVGEFHLGMQFQWEGFELGYSQTLVTNEFEGQNSGNRTGTWTLIFNLAH